MSLFLAILLVLSPLVVHEAGHWAVLRRLNVPVVEFWLGLGPVLLRWGPLRVGMLPIGGAVVPEPVTYRQMTPLQRQAVALAGPAASLLYGFVLLAVAQWNVGTPGFHGLELLAVMNFWLAFLNMVPVPPLDGFQALVAWREHRGNPFSPRLMAAAHRLGSGMVYGIGFFVLISAFIR